MSFDHLPALTDRPRMAIPKDRPRILLKAAKDADAKTVADAMVKTIRKRDKNRCRCCGVFVHFDSIVLPLKQGQVHHIIYRSKGGANDSNNLVLVCAKCHAKIHAHEIEVVGTSAKDVQFRKVA
jgi:5-methylcytosine-specific restriction endonuclease McrA